MSFPEVLADAVALASYYEGIPGIIEDYIPKAELVQDEITGTGRWDIDHEAVYKYDDRYWEVWYAEPATEMQDWEHDTYKVFEVRPEPVVVTKYVKVT